MIYGSIVISNHVFFLSESFKVTIDDGYTEQDSSSGSEGADEVSDDGEATDANTSKSGSNGDVSFEDVVHGRVSMALDLHVLGLELFKDVLGSLATDFDPLAGEEGTGAQDEGDVEESVDGVTYHG